MRKYLLHILILIALIGLFSPIVEVRATTEYKLLAPLPKVGDKVNLGGDHALGAYLNPMIELFIGICAVLSVVMIVVGGLEVMTSEIAHTKEAGRQRIWNAILGLLIALGAYALLNTINKDLLKSDVNIQQDTPAGPIP